MNTQLGWEPLPWDALTPVDFERLVFFLLDDMGFKSIEWRKGGQGISASDDGRDLDAVYTKLEPDDALTCETWWLEVKYRSQTLSPATIKQAVVNATGCPDVDVFVIVTNSHISNSTVDWVKGHQGQWPKPRVVLWQRHDVERMLRKYPGTVARFFGQSLDPTSRQKVVEERFWNYAVLPTLEEVEDLWANYQDLEWNPSNLLPLLVTEASIGLPAIRQWGLVADESLLVDVLAIGLANVPPLLVRLEKYGHRNDSLIAGLAYLLQMALLRLDTDTVMDVLLEPYTFTDSPIDAPEELVDFILRPIVSLTYHDLAINCAQDCQRVLSPDELRSSAGSFFDRFVGHEQQRNQERAFVWLMNRLSPCSLAIVETGDWCPLAQSVPDGLGRREVLRGQLAFAQEVIQTRANRVVDDT